VISACQLDSDTEKQNDFALAETDYHLDCDPVGDDTQARACQLAYYANRQRRAHFEESDHAEPLDWSDELAKVAVDYSRRMCDEGFFDHDDPQGCGMEHRLQEGGVFYAKAGENLARGTDLLPSEAMAMFLDEPSCARNHRGNVLDNDFTHTGVGTDVCDNKVIYTQLFATFDPEDLRDDANEYCSN